MGKVAKASIAILSVAIIGIIGVGVFISQTGGDLETTATNAAIDVSGIKQKAEDKLKENREEIAAATGLSLDQVDAAIVDLDIGSWKATVLPSNAQSTGSFETSYGGMSGTVTTYTDPSYVTVESSGQTITLEVPDSAQSYLAYLSYL